jgi:hypothetical protein
MKVKLGWYATGTLVALVVLATSGCGPAEFKPETGGSEEAIKKVESGGTFYSPPVGAPVPGSQPPGGAPSGVPTGPPSGG